MIDTIEKRNQLEDLVKEMNELVTQEKYKMLSKKIEQLIELYLGVEINPNIKRHMKTYIEDKIWSTEEELVLEEGQKIIKIGRDFIRQGAWHDGSEEPDNINYFHPLNKSKYVKGFTCGDLKYQCAYPNQLVDIMSSHEGVYKIYKYNDITKEEIEVQSIEVCGNFFQYKRSSKVLTLDNELISEDQTMFYYEQTPSENIEITPDENGEKQLRLNRK